ncbi:hypothetical protein D2Q93_10070 [Alicyclobacillaceae bacterium I2511]|nr:hypothetical protein D2Q93_10070 [Alicyclobacillaceae bacterium I2511]
MFMINLILFYLLFMIFRIFANPLLALVLILLIYYVIDRRYIGLLPGLIKPLRQWRRITTLNRQLTMNPHDSPLRLELAQVYMARNHFQRALSLLEQLPAPMKDSADVLYDTGACQLSLGELQVGKTLVLQALSLNPDLRYGEPYLKLATALALHDPAKALKYLQEFQLHNRSSCESYYRMAQLQEQLGDPGAARNAWRQCLETYRILPNFRKRADRRWALLARLKLLMHG